MAFPVQLPVAWNEPLMLPSGWEPFSLGLARQGEVTPLLCRRQADDGTLPPSDKPVLDSLTPNSMASGGTPATVDVRGSGFDASSVIHADGGPRATFYLSATQLEYTARPDLEPPGAVQITVVSGNGTSNALTFTYT